MEQRLVEELVVQPSHLLQPGQDELSLSQDARLGMVQSLSQLLDLLVPLELR